MSEDTVYVQMLLDLDNIPWNHNFCAGLFNWILLAGYLIVPGTFTSLQKSNTIQNHLDQHGIEQAILNTIQNPPLLFIASILFFFGAVGMLWLGRTWRNNYIWLINRLFLSVFKNEYFACITVCRKLLTKLSPGLLNSFAGLLTSLINVYTAQSGDWSIMATATITITGLSTTVTASLFFLYKFQKLRQVKQAHEHKMRKELRKSEE